ncbi:hypothetical protein ABB37_03418 [Leptomonas pyrrhocoris]|uniref:Uncharacterized protein n=1 Tax=Leptomonas pyrrhocoris TaxID=157538 RepID=A0A0N0VG53_LEPPY|nr:hypothetical protein ABB37_03418 [Leptomonas pyrrhocoris]XP_015660764.1 hypothetical protein ABB37_03418 [Leptomonas pyrrhocoris]KPA82324.1 hypothetical protein ABB37_03418 [Leptomonas pyrrhocoris]KPA82325.1 hypothetical protein ABB37_03418 [Leptomonas pyrrhocoris]|eukprot:XP_015660763.1 hypothetical protein ABB37_03418 [Leptomonas pyrrhocoris]
MSSVSPAPQTPSKPSLRLRDPSLANAGHNKASAPRHLYGPKRFCGVVEVEPRPLACDGVSATPTVECAALLSPTAFSRPQCIVTPAAGVENGTAARSRRCTPRPSSRISHLLSPISNIEQRVIVAAPQKARGMPARSAARACSSASHKTETLTQMALTAVLRLSNNEDANVDDVMCRPITVAPHTLVDDVPAGFVSLRCHCDGAEWCAVVKAHTEAVHWLATSDILAECGISSRELTGLTLIAADGAGLDLLFQLATSNDARYETALRDQMERCAFPRLQVLYRMFLSDKNTATPVEFSEDVKSVDGLHRIEPRCLAIDCTEAADTDLAESEMCGTGAGCQQLLAEFEAALEDVRFVQHRREQEVEHVRRQLEEERRNSALQMVDFKSQLTTKRLGHECLDSESESISAALFETQKSCVQLRQLLSESEERLRCELHKAQMHYQTLETEHERLVAGLHDQIHSLQEALSNSQAALQVSKLDLDDREAHNARYIAALEERLAAALRKEVEACPREETLPSNMCKITDTLSIDVTIESNAALSDRVNRTDAREALEGERCGAPSVSTDEIAEAYEAFNATKQRCTEPEADGLRSVALLNSAVAAAKEEVLLKRDPLLSAKGDVGLAESPRVADAAVVEKRTCSAERGLSAARHGEEAPARQSTGVVAELRSDYEARTNELVTVTREIVAAREALHAATVKCSALDAERAAAVRNEAAEAEMAAAREELRLAEARYLAADAAAASQEDEEKSAHWESVVERLSMELGTAKERINTLLAVNKMLRDKFRSDLRCCL